MLVAVLFELYKLYRITSACIAITTKTTVRIGYRINLQARGFVRVEGT